MEAGFRRAENRLALAANAELDGFSATGGKWHAESGGVVGRQDQFLSSLKCETEFGNDWELSADVDVLYPSDYSANAAISIYGQSGVLVYNIKLLTSTSSVSIAPEWRADKPHQVRRAHLQQSQRHHATKAK